MGIYSTFTYLGITVVSAINSLVIYLGAPPETILLLLFIWSLPAYIFLTLLWLAIRNTNTDNNERQKIEGTDDTASDDQALEGMEGSIERVQCKNPENKL